MSVAQRLFTSRTHIGSLSQSAAAFAARALGARRTERVHGSRYVLTLSSFNVQFSGSRYVFHPPGKRLKSSFSSTRGAGNVLGGVSMATAVPLDMATVSFPNNESTNLSQGPM